MVKNSKLKGKSWEREICKIFRKYFGGKFIRTPHSGALVGGNNKVLRDMISKDSAKTLKGDILPPEDHKNIVTEAKNYSNFLFHSLFTENKTLNSWIKQLEDAVEEEEVGFLVIKISRKGTFIIVNSSKININNCLDLNHMVYHFSDNKYYMFDLELFLERFTNSNKR